MTWDVGDLVPVQTTLKVSGVLTNATMALTVTSPSGIVTIPAVTNASTGVYTANVPATEAGDWAVVWSASGAATAVQPSQFSVAALGLRLISLDEAKEQLNIPATVTTNDEELRRKIGALTRVVERRVGPIIPRTVSETVDVYGDRILLGYWPVLSLTSIVAAQTSYTAPALGELTLEPETGSVYYTAGGNLPTGRARFTYRAGRQPIPDNLREGAAIILEHMWETQHNRGGGRPQFGGEELVDIGMGFLVPNRAAELLDPDMPGSAVA